MGAEGTLELLHRACQCAEQVFTAQTSGFDITPRQFAILAKIDELESPSQIMLVEHTGIDRSTMVDVVRRLLKKRLVQRRRAKIDARTFALALTPDGRALLDRVKPIASRVDKQLLATLPANRVEDFLVSLALLVQGAQGETDA